LPKACSPSSLRVYNVVSPRNISSTYIPDNNAILDVIPQDVPAYYWNDVEAPQGIRFNMNLKARFTVR
jgi:hypothetical protein